MFLLREPSCEVRETSFALGCFLAGGMNREHETFPAPTGNATQGIFSEFYVSRSGVVTIFLAFPA
jgi:hypothetical protein